MIVKAKIMSDILNMFDILKDIKDSEEAKSKYAELLTDVIYNTILSADIPILPVQVVPLTGTGATTAPAKLI